MAGISLQDRHGEATSLAQLPILGVLKTVATDSDLMIGFFAGRGLNGPAGAEGCTL